MKGNTASMIKIRKLLLLSLAWALAAMANAQNLDVKRMEFKDENVVIHYSLLDTVPGRRFTVNLYASRDNYINPLTRVRGDHGLEVKAGNDKTVTWLAKEELGENFNGAVSVEVRARVYVPFIQLDRVGTIKRGKPKEVTWRGGTRQNILNFELYNSKGEKVHVIPNISNSGHTSLFIPADVKPGKDYTFRIVDSKNKDQVVNTDAFTIKRRIPILMLALPAAVVGGLAAFLGGGGGGEPPPSSSSEIPGPPDPPN